MECLVSGCTFTKLESGKWYRQKSIYVYTIDVILGRKVCKRVGVKGFPVKTKLCTKLSFWTVYRHVADDLIGKIQKIG